MRILSNDHLSELRSQAKLGCRSKDRVVEIDARALLAVLRELESRRPAALMGRMSKKSRLPASAV